MAPDDATADADDDGDVTTMRVHQDTLLRLDRRSTDADNSYEDVVTRLLDETQREVSLRTAVEAACDQFGLENIGAVNVSHLPSYEHPNLIRVTVFTSDAEEFEDSLDVFGPEYRIPIERDGADDVRARVYAFATFDGPTDRDDTETTTVYVSESMMGIESLPLETGLAHLEQKLTTPDDWERSYQGPFIEQIKERVASQEEGE